MLLFIPVTGFCKEIKAPEKVVKEFYASIRQQDDASLEKAYAMLAKNHTVLDIDTFKHVVLSFSKDMTVTIVSKKIVSSYAIVTIKCTVPSYVGGALEVLSDVHLILDKDTDSWGIRLDADAESDI